MLTDGKGHVLQLPHPHSKGRVAVESPFKASEDFTEEDNILFAQRCCRWVVAQNFNPIASHLFYTQFLNDSIPRERARGIILGYEWLLLCDQAWFFKREGTEPSDGMIEALKTCVILKVPAKFFDVVDTPESFIVKPFSNIIVSPDMRGINGRD